MSSAGNLPPGQAPPGPPPGWYPDPSGLAEQRYWDGARWTGGVSRAGLVWEAGLAPGGGPPSGSSLRDEPGRGAELPGRALGIAFAGIAAAVVLSLAAGFGAHLLNPHAHHSVAVLVASQLGLWAGLVGALVVVSRRYGTGSLTRDYRLRVRGIDPLLGLGISFAERLVATLVVIPILVASKRLVGSNTVAFKPYAHSWAGFLSVVLIAVVGAPLIEELFFRGLVLESLRHRLPVPAAIVGQGVIFALCHFQPVLGLANVGVIVGVGAFGIIQGISATWFRRLGVNVWAHAFFNLPVIAILLASR